jgi:hypothetical protein
MSAWPHQGYGTIITSSPVPWRPLERIHALEPILGIQAAHVNEALTIGVLQVLDYAGHRGNDCTDGKCKPLKSRILLAIPHMMEA